jgi:urease accessory protein
LETWIQQGVLRTTLDVEQTIDALLTCSIAPGDGIACKLAHQFALGDDEKRFVLLNEYLCAGRWCRETLEASLSMGERLKQLAVNAGWPGRVPPSKVHHSTVFGWLTGQADVPCDQAVAALLYSSCTGLVSACVRLVPLGHTDGQRILSRLRIKIEDLVLQILRSDLDDLGSFAPMHEWACKQHETLYSRLFQS